MTSSTPHNMHKPCITTVRTMKTAIFVVRYVFIDLLLLLLIFIRFLSFGHNVAYHIQNLHPTPYALHCCCKPLLAGWKWVPFLDSNTTTTATNNNAATPCPTPHHMPHPKPMPYAAAVSLCSQGGNGSLFWTATLQQWQLTTMPPHHIQCHITQHCHPTWATAHRRDGGTNDSPHYNVMVGVFLLAYSFSFSFGLLATLLQAAAHRVSI
jgi:hypothetical protein